ncbi:hypothetical protein ABIF97_004128 [Bradyrhizobium japonicum]
MKLAENSGLDLKASHLSYRHYDRELRAQQLRDAQDRPDLVDKMRVDLRRTEWVSPIWSLSAWRSLSMR